MEDVDEHLIVSGIEWEGHGRIMATWHGGQGPGWQFLGVVSLLCTAACNVTRSTQLKLTVDRHDRIQL